MAAIRPFVSIEMLDHRHVAGWRRLWAMDTKGAIDEETLDYTQAQILDDKTPLFALIALNEEDDVVAFLHGVLHPVAGSKNLVCYMQDLYVHPTRRRQGIASMLLENLQNIGLAQGWDRIYWLADASNEGAKALYKNRALALDFSFHILPLAMLDKLEELK